MDKFSELKDALEFLETTEFDGEWDSALVGGENGKNYHAVVNANDVVVRAADDSRHTSWLCDYLEAASPVKVRALLAELEQANTRAEVESVGADKSAADCVQWMKRAEAAEKRIAELENDEIRQRLANAEHQLHMAELANYNLRASRKAQFRKRKAAEANLKEMTTFRDNALNKALRYWEELLELRAKLATPVRLPVVLMGYQSDDYRLGFMEGVEKSREEVRSAGFTVEGDE